MHAVLRIAAAGLALAGCATAHATVADLRGQPIEAAIGLYGYPAAEREIAGRKLFVWNRQAVSAGVQLNCELVYEVDAGRRIVDGELQGQNGACDLFGRP